jgi:hypothetical protein
MSEGAKIGCKVQTYKPPSNIRPLHFIGCSSIGKLLMLSVGGLPEKFRWQP